MTGKVCFLGGARYRHPLDPTSAKKFRAMRSLGEIFVIGFSTDMKPRIFTEHARFYLLPQLPLPVLRYLELFVLGPLLILWLILFHRVSVIVAQSPYEGIVAASMIKMVSWLGCRVGLAVEVHGDFEHSLFAYRNIKFSRMYRSVMNHAARYSLARADVLRAISDSTKQQLQRWAPNAEILQFSAWTDIEPFLARGRARQPDRANTILYAGVLTPLKGVHHLIAAFGRIAARFATANLVIAGADQNRSYAAKLRKQVVDANLGSRVQFIGHLPQVELAERMAEASVLVLPSESEGFGRVLLEAMAAGTPVIGSRVGGIPELIIEGSTGFLIGPGDEAALAAKLSWLFDNRQQARQMGQVAHQFAAQMFTTERYLQGYREVFALAEQATERSEHAASAL